MSEVDYSEVLADLERRREKIEAAIEGIRAVMGLESANGRGTPTGPGDVPEGAFLGKTIAESILIYLDAAKKPQTAKEIEGALLEGGVHSTAKDFYNTVYSVLRRELRAGEVIKVGRGKWGLAEWYPARPKNRNAVTNTESAEPESEEEGPLNETEDPSEDDDDSPESSFDAGEADDDIPF